VRVAGREIDVVARRGGTLVLCEVKARRTGWRGAAVEAVSAAQRRRLRQAAEVALARDPALEHVRIDLVAVDGWRVTVVPAAL
jgi:putative endonuclease